MYNETPLLCLFRLLMEDIRIMHSLISESSLIEGVSGAFAEGNWTVCYPSSELFPS